MEVKVACCDLLTICTRSCGSLKNWIFSLPSSLSKVGILRTHLQLLYYANWNNYAGIWWNGMKVAKSCSNSHEFHTASINGPVGPLRRRQGFVFDGHRNKAAWLWWRRLPCQGRWSFAFGEGSSPKPWLFFESHSIITFLVHISCTFGDPKNKVATGEKSVWNYSLCFYLLCFRFSQS
jgi:hypothetical protein